MLHDVPLTNLPGYVSVKEAADLLGISDKRVYQYVTTGRLSAHRIGNTVVLPLEQVKQFKPGSSGRRTKTASWRSYKGHGTILITEIRVQVRAGQHNVLVDRLKAMEQEHTHLFPGTVARYVFQGDSPHTTTHILLMWKDTEMPDELARQSDITAFQDALSDVLDWETATFHCTKALLHT